MSKGQPQEADRIYPFCQYFQVSYLSNFMVFLLATKIQGAR